MRPVTPQPSYTEANLEAILASGQFVYADCYTIIPKVGPILYYTNAQQDVSVVPIGGATRVTYFAHDVILDGLLVKSTLGAQVDQQDVQIAYPQSTTSFQNYLSWPQALLQGRLDGAKIRRDRFIAASWQDPWVGGFPMFLGLVSSLSSVGRQTATISVKSDLVLLDVQMPRDLFTPTCRNNWGDSLCGVNQADWAVLGTVAAGSSRTKINWTGATAAMALGKIHYTAGDTVTRVRTISRVVAGTALYLSYPLDFTPNTGDVFTAYPNCGRLKANCLTYHGEPNWRGRFKGFPFVPVAETALGA